MHRSERVEPWGAVLHNLKRQLETPFTVKLGSTFLVQAWADQGHYMYPFASAKRVDLDLGTIGRWVIDPATWITLPAMQMPATRRSSVSLKAPTDPGFIGVEFCTQAVEL